MGGTNDAVCHEMSAGGHPRGHLRRLNKRTELRMFFQLGTGHKGTVRRITRRSGVIWLTDDNLNKSLQNNEIRLKKDTQLR